MKWRAEILTMKCRIDISDSSTTRIICKYYKALRVASAASLQHSKKLVIVKNLNLHYLHYFNSHFGRGVGVVGYREKAHLGTSFVQKL